MIHELRGIKETLRLSETNTRNAVALHAGLIQVGFLPSTTQVFWDKDVGTDPRASLLDLAPSVQQRKHLGAFPVHSSQLHFACHRSLSFDR